MRDSTARLCLSCGAQNPQPFLGIGYCGSCRVRLTRGGRTNAAKSLSEKSVWQTHRGAIVWTLVVGAFIAFATFNSRQATPYASAKYTPPYVASPPPTGGPNYTDAETGAHGLSREQKQAIALAEAKRKRAEAEAASGQPRMEAGNWWDEDETVSAPPQPSVADPRAELERLRKMKRLQELEAKALANPPVAESQQQQAGKQNRFSKYFQPTPEEARAEIERRNASRVAPPPPVFDEPVVAIATGEIRYTGPRPRVAPLEIKAPYGADYYIKLVHALTGRTHLVGFVRGGSTVEFLMPVGEYEMKYAVGTEWYGEKHLFGPMTAYARADAPLNFTKAQDGYEGYTIELWEREGGNLETQEIAASSF